MIIKGGDEIITSLFFHYHHLPFAITVAFLPNDFIFSLGKMDLKPFCNKCLKTQVKALVVSSCRHVLCSECYAKTTPRCCYCKAECKVIPFEKLPDEMSVYFKPILPVLKKYLKIARFQLLQRSLWTAKRKFVLERVHLMKRNATDKKERLAQLRQNYKKALQRNAELKKRLK